MVVEIGALIEGATLLLEPRIIGFMILGVLLGIVVGTIPGIGSTVGMALLLPFTFGMGSIEAILLLIGIYSGSLYAGSIPAILINTPGSGSGAAAVLEGYPLAQKGKAKEAIAAAATSSAIGGSFGILVLILLAPFVLTIVLLFGSPEYFLVTLMGIALITFIAKGSMLKGIVSGAFGLALTTVGISPIGGTSRYTFGVIELMRGLDFIAVLLGVFALAEMYKLSTKEGSIADDATSLGGSALDGVKETLKRPVTMFKSSMIGIFVGAIPGAGASTATFVAYIEAVRSSHKPESYGKGNMTGVVAVDSASNSTMSGTLIPTLSFGIPGGAATAVLLGALIMHGLTPGPDLFGANLNITYAIFLGLLLGNIVILTVGILVINRAAYLTQIDTNILIPCVIVLAFCGSFVLNNNWIEPLTVFAFGILGYYMVKYNYSIIALLLGVILGPIAEDNLIRSLTLSQGSVDIFYSTPLGALLIALTIIILFGPMAKSAYGQLKG